MRLILIRWHHILPFGRLHHADKLFLILHGFPVTLQNIVSSVTDVDEKDEAYLLAGEDRRTESIHVDFARTVKLKANEISPVVQSFLLNCPLFTFLSFIMCVKYK